MDSDDIFQGVAPVNLREKYDHASEEWFRVRRAIKTGALRHIPPTFRVGGRRIYCRAELDRELSLRKFGEDIAKARAHRVCDSPLVARHLSPIEATPPPLGFDRAYALAWQEHRALARINRPTPKKKLSLTASPPLQWALNYEIDEDGEFNLTGGMARAGRKTQQGGDHE